MSDSSKLAAEEGQLVTDNRTPTVLCIATFEKGQEFMRECKRQGCRVILLTMEKLSEADWPHESLDEIFYLPADFALDDLIKSVSYAARTRRIDRIVPLDDFDVETAAALREHLRLPGMGDTTTRYFRDKLAMRVKAMNHGILVPDFIHVLNYEAIREFMQHVSPPWVLKPRGEASTVGIKKVKAADDLWPLLDELGDRQSFHLLEKFIPGDIYHVDSIVSEGEVVFNATHMYGQPPMEVAHEGGVFMTRTIPRDSDDARTLATLNRELISTLGLVRGVTHTEFIRGHEDGHFYFLETAARVGGANIAEVVEAATGVNLWGEWAKLEIAGEQGSYNPPSHRDDYAGIVISLARQEYPDTSAYDDDEIVWRLNKRHHVGLIVSSQDPARIEQLLQDYVTRFYDDFFAIQPLPDRPMS